MALVRELIRQGRTGLHLIGSAHSIDVDLLVAAGAVRRCEESYVGFEQDLGLAPAYRRAAEQGSIEVAESCCATILAQLRAAEMGLPFLPVRGVRGSDIARLHPEYAEITCPFTGETAGRGARAAPRRRAAARAGRGPVRQPAPRAAVRAGRAVRLAARAGRRHRGRAGLHRGGAAAGITIPGHLVAAVAEVPFGAHPSSCYPRYAYDRDHLARVRDRGAGRDRTWRQVPGRLDTERHRGGLPASGGRGPAGRADRLVAIHHRVEGAIHDELVAG